MMTYRVSPEISYRSVYDEVVILDVKGDRYLGLNQSGAVVWETLAQGGSPTDAVDALVTRFGIDRDRSRSDVDALIADLVKNGLLEVAAG